MTVDALLIDRKGFTKRMRLPELLREVDIPVPEPFKPSWLTQETPDFSLPAVEVARFRVSQAKWDPLLKLYRAEYREI